MAKMNVQTVMSVCLLYTCIQSILNLQLFCLLFSGVLVIMVSPFPIIIGYNAPDILLVVVCVRVHVCVRACACTH